MATKKMLVAFDKSKPTATSSDFLAPIWEGEYPCFLGLKSGRFQEYGLVVFTGRQIEVNDVFAKMVDSGHKILGVDRTLSGLGA